VSCCGGTGAWRPDQEVAEPRRHERADPLAILAERLARGEITVEEYERIREVLDRDRAVAPSSPQPAYRRAGC